MQSGLTVKINPNRKYGQIKNVIRPWVHSSLDYPHVECTLWTAHLVCREWNHLLSWAEIIGVESSLNIKDVSSRRPRKVPVIMNIVKGILPYFTKGKTKTSSITQVGISQDPNISPKIVDHKKVVSPDFWPHKFWALKFFLKFWP